MNKLFMPIIAVALLIASVVCTPASIIPVVTVGAGTGENAEISEVEDLIPVIDFILSRTQGTVESADISKYKEIMTLSASDAEAKVENTKQYSSVMLIEDTSLDAVVFDEREVLDSDGIGNTRTETISKTIMSMDRSLTIVFDGDASYYMTKGSTKYVYENYIDSEKSYESYMAFDMNIYMDKETTLLNIKKLDYAGESIEMGEGSEYIGQWIKVPNEFAVEMFNMVDEMNRTFFEQIKGYVAEISEENTNKKVFNFEDALYGEENDTDVTIDISDPEAPYINMLVRYSEDENSMYMSDTLSFFNIDNSVIKVNMKNVKTVDEEEFERIFMGE